MRRVKPVSSPPRSRPARCSRWFMNITARHPRTPCLSVCTASAFPRRL
jgi:hypothetical protein